MSRSLRTSLYLLIFFAVFNFTSSIMGGGYVVGSLGGSSEISTYGVTFFGLGNACTFPLGSALGKRFGIIQVLLVALIPFSFLTYLCGTAPTFFVFILFRFLAGVFSGVFFPLSFALISDHVSEKQKDTTFAFLGLITSVTPVLGACFGGWVAYDLNWPWIFYSQIPIFFVIGYILYIHKTPHLVSRSMAFDKVGFIFYVLSIGSIVTSIALGQQLDWFRSPLICFLLVSSVIYFVFFCLWELNHEDPFIDLNLFKIPIFSLSILCVFVLFSAYFGMILLLSLWLHIDANYSPLWISLLIAHMGVAGAILFFVLKKWFQKVASLWVVLLAISFFAISCFYSTAFNAEIDFGRLAIARTWAGFGLAFFLFPLLFACLKELSPLQIPQGISVFQSSRLLAGSLGCAAYTTVWFRRKIFYHDRLGSQLTMYSEQTKQFFSNISFYGPKGLEADQLLDRALEVQSDALALADCFYLMGWMMVGVFVILASFLIKTYLDKKKAQTLG